MTTREEPRSGNLRGQTASSPPLRNKTSQNITTTPRGVKRQSFVAAPTQLWFQSPTEEILVAVLPCQLRVFQGVCATSSLTFSTKGGGRVFWCSLRWFDFTSNVLWHPGPEDQRPAKKRVFQSPPKTPRTLNIFSWTNLIQQRFQPSLFPCSGAHGRPHLLHLKGSGT